MTVPPDPNAAGLMPARRLTSREFLNTVRDLLNDTTLKSRRRSGESDDLSNNALPVPPADRDRNAGRGQRAGRRRGAGEEHLEQAVDDPAVHARERLGGGGMRGHVHHDLRREGVPPSARRRRDDDADRRSTDTARTTLALDFNGAIGLLVEAMLQSPRLPLPLGDRSGPGDQGRGVVQLGNYQMANRLSYFLWGTMPDSALFTAAQSGQLTTADGVQTQVTRMLADTQGAGVRRGLHRRLAGRQRAVLAAQGSDAVRDVEPGSRVRDGDRVPQLRHHDRPRQRALRRSDDAATSRRSTRRSPRSTASAASPAPRRRRSRSTPASAAGILTLAGLPHRHRAPATGRRRSGAGTRSGRASSAARSPTRPATCRRRCRRRRG